MSSAGCVYRSWQINYRLWLRRRSPASSTAKVRQQVVPYRKCRRRVLADPPATHTVLLRHRTACRQTDARRRAAAFARAFGAHVTRLQSEPQAYGELGLADLLEMREEALREFGFLDVYRCPVLHAARCNLQLSACSYSAKGSAGAGWPERALDPSGTGSQCDGVILRRSAIGLHQRRL